ncbi:MAG: DUF697 domain-containing protein [Dehalococcoidia bacterium]|nr:DUF697 domain-containing protein [Dehalococcoidia bacterium]
MFLRRASLIAGILLLVIFVIFVANQTAQFVGLISSLNPAAGSVALVALLAIYAFLAAVPIVLFIRLPRAISPPTEQSSPEFETYVNRMKSRLASNPNLAGSGIAVTDRAGMEAAFKFLDAKADKIVKKTASVIFVSTAVSQSGRLDGLMVLVAQSQLVWRVAHVYNQRPSVQELVRLYTNVAFTTFASVQIEDLDVGDQVQSVLAPAITASAFSAIPGAGAVASVLTHAMVDGSANAFMTLRLGVIAKRYCSSYTGAKRPMLRRLASAEAAAMLGSIAIESGAVVSKAVIDAFSKAGRRALSNRAEAARETLAAAASSLAEVKDRTNQGISGPLSRGTSAFGEALGKMKRKPRSPEG